MPRRSFFDEFRRRYLTKECKGRRHNDCEGEVILSNGVDSPIKQKPCDCVCHQGFRDPSQIIITPRTE